MRTLLTLITLAAFTGCATQPLSCDEECSLSGMSCRGITSNHSTGAAFAEGQVLPVMSSTSGVVCEKPQNEKQVQEIVAAQAPAKQKSEANTTARTWNGVLIAVPLIIGGIVLIIMGSNAGK